MNPHYISRGRKSGKVALTALSPNRFSSRFSTSLTNGPRGEAGAFRMGVLSLSARTACSQTSPGRVSERQTLPLLGLGQVYSRRTQKACGTVMRSCASLFRRRRGPAGLRDLFLLLSKLQLARPALRAFCVCEVGVVSLPSVCSACCQSVPCAGVKTGNLPISEVG